MDYPAFDVLRPKKIERGQFSLLYFVYKKVYFLGIFSEKSAGGLDSELHLFYFS